MMFRLRASIMTTRPMEDDIAEVVNFVNLCLTLHTLPQSGGLLDQDSYQMFLIQTVTTWQNERQMLDNKKAGSRGT